MTECIVGGCVQEGTVLMWLVSFGRRKEEWFCDKHAERYEQTCWHRVGANHPEQLELQL